MGHSLLSIVTWSDYAIHNALFRGYHSRLNCAGKGGDHKWLETGSTASDVHGVADA